jgi:hypothetical protein
MEFLFGLAGMAVMLGVIALPVYVVHRLRASTRSMSDMPDDMRRADDGLDGRGGGGPGLGPMWPPN